MAFLLVFFHHADFLYQEVCAFDHLFVKAVAFRAVPFVLDYRVYAAAIAAAPDRFDLVYDEF